MFDTPLVAESLHPTKMRLDDALVPGEVERMAALMAQYDLIERVPACDDLLGSALCAAVEGNVR